MAPADFVAQFVRPAIELWNERKHSPVAAVCALAQIDILAEVVAHKVVGSDRTAVASFRDGLGTREPAIRRIRDTHDSHKHGRLSRRSAQDVTQGQRPYRSNYKGFLIGDIWPGEDASEFETAVLLDDGTPLFVATMLQEAMDAWSREFTRLGIPVTPGE